MHQDAISKLLNRPIDSYKYNFGHVLILGGSEGMVGAPLLTARACLRSGGGLVTIASNKQVAQKLEARVEEAMTLSLPNKPKGALETVLQFIKSRKVTVMVLGPGMDPFASNKKLVRSLIKQLTIPIIIDGGALSALQDNLEILSNLNSEAIILTPHIGEFERLQPNLPKIRTDLKQVAKGFSEKHKVNLVLKGNPTYVAHPDGTVYENTTGNPGLASAGTGDVLSGIIAAIVAQKIDYQEATDFAVYIHGLAGDIAKSVKTEPGMIASDVIEAIPQAYKSLV